MSRWLTVLLICCLLFSFVVCGLASYVGFAIKRVGIDHPDDEASVRSGSTTGPRVSGGGPGSGK